MNVLTYPEAKAITPDGRGINPFHMPPVYHLIAEAWTQRTPALWYAEPGMNIDPNQKADAKRVQAKRHTIIGTLARVFPQDKLAAAYLPFYAVRDLHNYGSTETKADVFAIYSARLYEVHPNGLTFMDAILDRLEAIIANPSPDLAARINLPSHIDREELEVYVQAHLLGQAEGAWAEEETIRHLNTLAAKWGATCVPATSRKDEYDDVDAYILTATGRIAAAVSVKNLYAMRNLHGEQGTLNTYRGIKGKTRPDIYAGFPWPRDLDSKTNFTTYYPNGGSHITAMLVEDHHATLGVAA